MKIDFLQNLRDNPKLGLFENEPIELEEIHKLELLYNNGDRFPKALRELLFLAGGYCEVLDFGLNDTQQEMQEEARSWLPIYKRQIPRPFYVIDVYNSGDQFLFVYLDDNELNPIVYEAVLYEHPYDSRPWIHSSLLAKTLSQFIDNRLDILKRGENPF
jgi:hypothetical protein